MVLAGDLVEGPAAAGAVRRSQRREIRGVPEGHDERAVMIGRQAEKLSRQLMVVDGRRRATDPQLPGREHHVLRRSPEVPYDRLAARAIRVGRHERDGRCGAGQVPAIATNRGELAQMLSALYHDENPPLLVLGPRGPSPRIADS